MEVKSKAETERRKPKTELVGQRNEITGDGGERESDRAIER